MLKRLAILAFVIGLHVFPLQSQPIPSPNLHEDVSSEKDTLKEAVVSKNPDEYTVKGFWINVILTGITLIVGVAALLQASAARKQANAQMDAGRAWILAKVEGQPDEPLTKNLFNGVTPGLVWKVEIFGNTPARIIREDYRCRIVPPDPVRPSIPMLEPTPVYLPDADFVEGRVVSPPGEKHLVWRILEPEPGVMMDKVAQVVVGKQFLCAYGRIEYEDAFGRSGITQFCAIYRPSIGAVIKSPEGIVLNLPGFRIGGPPGYNYNT